jgi:hypothetical protein
MTHHTSHADQVIASRDAVYMRRRLRYDYKALCRRARDNRLSIEQIMKENSRISNILRYVEHFEAMRPYMFKMKLTTLASYADAITRLNIKHVQFFYRLAAIFGTLTDDELVDGETITVAGNLAYIVIKSPHAGISNWASLMLKRIQHASRRRRSTAVQPSA